MDRFGKWEVSRELGEGGQGKVYLVHDADKHGAVQPGMKSVNMPEYEGRLLITFQVSNFGTQSTTIRNVLFTTIGIAGTGYGIDLKKI